MIDDDNKVSAIDTPEAALVAARLGIRPDDPAWVLAQAVADAVMAQARAEQAATKAKIEVRTIPSKIKFGAQEAGKEMMRSMVRSHRLLSFSASGGIILIAMLVGTIFCWMGLALSGHINPTNYEIRSIPGGEVEIRAPGQVNASWCAPNSAHRNCLILKTEGEAK